MTKRKKLRKLSKTEIHSSARILGSLGGRKKAARIRYKKHKR